MASSPGSPLLHIPIALGFQGFFFLLYLLGGVPFALPLVWIAALPGLIYCFARENTQYEYQYIEAHGGLRANMPEFEGLKFWRWNTHSKRETLLAALSVFVSSLLVTLILH